MPAQHTPGPWAVCTDGANVYQPDLDLSITGTDSPTGCVLDDTERAANAALIAAAPDMLAALLDTYCGGCHTRVRHRLYKDPTFARVYPCGFCAPAVTACRSALDVAGVLAVRPDLEHADPARVPSYHLDDGPLDDGGASYKNDDNTEPPDDWRAHPMHTGHGA